jgi:glucose/arabinose dehydrogenase
MTLVISARTAATRRRFRSLAWLACLLVSAAPSAGGRSSNVVNVAVQAAKPAAPQNRGCDAGNGGIRLPPGFCASVFADNLGHARQLAVAPGGVVYVNTWSSAYTKYDNARGGFVVALKDADGDGHAEIMGRFGTVHERGKAGGGTGIAVHAGALYVEDTGTIVRYPLVKDTVVPDLRPTTVLSGMPLDGDHPMHPFAITADGTLFVNSGSASNACQVRNRARESPGRTPCTELATRAGIWIYSATTDGQVFSSRERYATGLRNSVALAARPAEGGLYAVVHGREQLSDNWPGLYTDDQNNNLPAEIMARIARDEDFGWPQCYFDAAQNKHVLAPEYGGDGGRAQAGCAGKAMPQATFPAHWAPNALTFYTGPAFPAKYRRGAFVSFHGSWNRKPLQSGYLVVFVPFGVDGPAGAYEEFATQFAGPEPPADPRRAAHRPMGVAAGPDGALYVTDDVKGRVWRISYVGGA